MEISPKAVDRDTLLEFHRALEAEDLIGNPRQKLKHTIAIWNMCHRGVAEWPDIHLSSPFDRDLVALPLCEFPQSFRYDLAKWRDRLLNPDLMVPAMSTR